MKKLSLLLSSLFLVSLAIAQPGALDPTFGVNGQFTLHKEFSQMKCDDVALTKDGKILILSDGNYLQRFNADGSLDSAFGIAGRVTILEDMEDQPYGEAIAVDSMNRILVLAEDEYWYATFVVRLLSDGSQDFSFGYYGATGMPFSNSSRAIAMQSDGKILAGGQSNYTLNSGNIVRLDTIGIYDSTFNGIGVFAFPDSLETFVFAITQESDGKLLATGTIDSNMFIARINSNGKLDSTFGANGINIVDEGNAEAGQDVIEMPDGKILVVGHTESSSQSSMLCWKFLQDGSADVSFGTNGVATLYTGEQSNFSWFALPDSDNSAIVGGSAFNGSYYESIMYRILSDGSIDNSFGENGIAENSFFSSRRFFQVTAARSNQGNIIVAATGFQSGTDLAAASEFSSDGVLDSSFADHGTVWCAPIYQSWLTLKQVNDFLELDNGNILCFSGDEAFFRLTNNGILDSSYGENGFAFYPSPPNYGSRMTTNGNIIYTVSTAYPAGETLEKLISPYNYTVAIRKLDSDGILDTTYGDHGVLELKFMNYNAIELIDAAEQPDGKLLLVITTGYTNTTPGYLLRLNSDGSLDETFGDGGSLLFHGNILLRGDGKINCLIPNIPNSQFSLVRLLADGSPDPDFGDTVVVPLPENTEYTGKFNLDESNKILGQVEFFAILRLNENGSVDSTFSGDGYVETIGTDMHMAGMNPQPEPDNGVLQSEQSDIGYNVGIARWLGNGDIDLSFGSSGLSIIPSIKIAPLIRLQSDGKILGAAGDDSDFIMVRLINDIGVSVNGVDNKNSLQIFPNPTSDQLIIRYPFSSSEQVKITITDMTGKILRKEMFDENVQNYEMKVSDLLAGIYLLNLQTEKNSATVRFVKQ